MQSCVAPSTESTLQFPCVIRTHIIVIKKRREHQHTGSHGFDNDEFRL